ncbi:hypothetical protein CA267_010910 [Alteromonas pelagimontana]|uniref:Cell division protein FtsL n=1 Tax=Alteromonas pelagimontana TaxID=1858656 RepID=A0A6M4MF64_9ALTE|nr:hypothetical protein [Alteromonas pelagimontana]QJR81255.1 hypothetical protein CA267_010910 [Alteromonas pelagimontana]
MKKLAKNIAASAAFVTVIALQFAVMDKLNDNNEALSLQVNHLQNRVDKVNVSNERLVSKIEKMEEQMNLKPRQLLSMR